MLCLKKTAIFLICIIFLGFCLTNVQAAKTPKTRYEKIQKEIKKKKKALEKVKKKEVSILDEIESTNRALDRIKRELRVQRRKMLRNEKSISIVRSEAKKISKKVDRQKTWLRRKVVGMQKYGLSSFGTTPGSSELKTDPLMLLMTAKDIPQAVRKWHYLKRLAEYEYALLKDYSKNIQGLKQRQDHLAALMKKLKGQKNQLVKKKTVLRNKQKQKKRLLASVRKKRNLYKRMLAELKESSRKLRKLIDESEKIKYLQTGFARAKKTLSWPVKGVLALPYGSYRDPKFKTPVFRNGIHIKAKEGGAVKAVYSGKVVFADWFKGYGKVVIINHGEGYHTVYANLSEIFLSKGDIIKRGALIGRVGESGMLNAPGLYFEIRYKGKPLNPLQWLKRKG
ncbi:Murein hydrolase activator EnvC [hydrothermal vent metagenome]|uniref:Murein hydrolase activator EnvC n=1 Tax=hydrothermal vent metagenome TaxID=652676 RepID=A0A3B1CQ93_9ZZZZ